MKCCACGRPLKLAYLAFTSDDGAQEQHVGSDCMKHVENAGEAGWQPPQGGPRVYANRDFARAASGVRAPDGSQHG